MLTIIAELKNYIDCNNIKRQSYNIRMIDFVRTNDSFAKKPKQDSCADDSFPPTGEQQMTSEGYLDLDEFARNYQYVGKLLQ